MSASLLTHHKKSVSFDLFKSSRDVRGMESDKLFREPYHICCNDTAKLCAETRPCHPGLQIKYFCVSLLALSEIRAWACFRSTDQEACSQGRKKEKKKKLTSIPVGHSRLFTFWATQSLHALTQHKTWSVAGHKVYVKYIF